MMPFPLASPFCQAGLAGYSDRAMRVVARRRGCAYAVTEALLDVILCNGGQGLRKSIDINDEDHPVAGQIIGSEPQTMATAASLLVGAGYDVIDLNFACPVKKIRNKLRGGHMLLDDTTAVRVLQAVRQRVPASVPTTVSLRRGFDDSSESVERFERVVEAAWSLGYAAVRVHARTVEQKYQGRADWSFLTRVKQRWPNRTILGSGDVFTAEQAVAMKRQTGVDIVWIARGAIGNPWIFDHARRILAGQSPTSIAAPTVHDQREALQEHFDLAMSIHGEQLAGRRMRKMGIKYARFHPDAAAVKQAFVLVSSLTDWRGVLERFYSEQRAGVWPTDSAADEVNESSCVEAAVGAE